ncbi:hypothetical protein PIB30_030306 [Stylosanthes scabra]|uniref:Uncharacterized protein n=1 Tax=Stylosanthes scabra TaxID=79078 RepID=A0ABU6RBV8_9FABA|nr:hypothetical protein [Stylosanthes scabra]
MAKASTVNAEFASTLAHVYATTLPLLSRNTADVAPLPVFLQNSPSTLHLSLPVGGGCQLIGNCGEEVVVVICSKNPSRDISLRKQLNSHAASLVPSPDRVPHTNPLPIVSISYFWSAPCKSTNSTLFMSAGVGAAKSMASKDPTPSTINTNSTQSASYSENPASSSKNQPTLPQNRHPCRYQPRTYWVLLNNI